MTESRSTAEMDGRLYVASQVFDDGPRQDVRDPWSGDRIASIVMCDKARSELAVEACVGAFRETRVSSVAARRGVLRRIVALLDQRKNEMAELICRDAGKPLKLAAMEVERARMTFELSAEELSRPCGEVLPLDLSPMTERAWGHWVRVPTGPVLAFAPFNFPLNLVVHKVAPAIAAGCPVLLKPPPQAPLAALALSAIVREAGAIADSFQVLPCDVAVAERLVRDDRFATLSFTGSAKVGWALKAIAGKKQVLLELGGNGAVIVHRDGLVDDAANLIAIGGFAYAGQVCIKSQRVYAHAEVYPRLLERLVDQARSMLPASPLDGSSIVGPMIDEASAERVESWVREAVAAGGKVIVGGRRVGARMEPTVVEIPGSGKGLRLVDEEVFGPVITMHRYDEWEQALDLANDTRYGLQAALFTDSNALIRSAFARLDVGCLVVNEMPSFRVDSMPFGGMRDSGLGREGVRFAIDHFTQPKMLVMGEPMRGRSGPLPGPTRGGGS